MMNSSIDYNDCDGLHKGLISNFRCPQNSNKFKRSVESFEL